MSLTRTTKQQRAWYSKNYGITGGPFSIEQLEAGVSMGDLVYLEDEHSYKRMRKILKTNNNGKYAKSKQKDSRLDRYVNPAFWYVLNNSTEDDIVKYLFVELVEDLAIIGSSEEDYVDYIVQDNLLNKVPYVLLKHPELVKIYYTVFDLASHYLEYPNATPLIKVLDACNIEIRAKDVVDLIIENAISYGTEPSLVTDMKMFGYTNEDILSSGLCYLLKSPLCDHTGLVSIPLDHSELWSTHMKDPKAIKYHDATQDERILIHIQVYSALLPRNNV